MDPALRIRPAAASDAREMARVLVQSWRETYRSVMPDEVLDDPGLLGRREHFWTAALTDPRYAANRAAVAARDDAIVGVAMAGPALDPEATWSTQLYVLYLLAPELGSDAGAALLDAVVDPEQDVALWVADPNPRAQAFYRRHGFAFDGGRRVQHGVQALRMRRSGRTRRADSLTAG